LPSSSGIQAAVIPYPREETDSEVFGAIALYFMPPSSRPSPAVPIRFPEG
jgi:hypothetical protein